MNNVMYETNNDNQESRKITKTYNAKKKYFTAIYSHFPFISSLLN